MRVRRRAVFFLTFVSLAAVISVYYFFERPTNLDVTTIFSRESLDDTVLTSVSDEVVKTDNYLFDEIRLEQTNERSQLKQQLTEKIASDTLTAEEKNEAFNEMNDLIALESNETTLEMLIKGLGYTDALVRLDQDKASITVMSEELTREKANEIIFLVKSEMGDLQNVSVSKQSVYTE